MVQKRANTVEEVPPHLFYTVLSQNDVCSSFFFFFCYLENDDFVVELHKDHQNHAPPYLLNIWQGVVLFLLFSPLINKNVC